MRKLKTKNEKYTTTVSHAIGIFAFVAAFARTLLLGTQKVADRFWPSPAPWAFASVVSIFVCVQCYDYLSSLGALQHIKLAYFGLTSSFVLMLFTGAMTFKKRGANKAPLRAVRNTD